ncbi:major facilitator superfamily domain-containing protein [Echria macrotheca]|uniref:Major facilitator superfamily domain-containing protein n=1 Tax=Echria macrotheca TaxID=438768 RepID=A0AAJ0BP40_9PEZI|nr:major facilitator superfamily domain-containing protein [Echria macrotheca]
MSWIRSKLRPSGTDPSRSARQLPPYPSKQLFILALCRISEPIAFMSIFPYIYYMVRDFNITDDETKISFYAGMVTSAFTLAEFSTSLFWGRLSDKIGRKPVLLMGLGGTGLSVLLFGFAQTLPVALFARALGGFLNGNMAVLQTTVAELVTVKQHQAHAYAVMPMVWCVGSIVGPMIGGALAKPVNTMPTVFRPGGIFDRLPYLLPNLFSAVCVFMGVVIGVLFLEETHAKRKQRRDRGVELGNYLIARARAALTRPGGKSPEEQPLLGDSDEPLPGYSSTGPYPSAPAERHDESTVEDCLDAEETGVAAAARTETGTRTFSKTTILIIITFGILAFHTMVFDSLLPVFLSTERPEHRRPTTLPFKFADGFGYDTQTIGFILSVQGVYSMASTFFFFPWAVQRLNARRLFWLISVSYPLLYITTPYLVFLPDTLRMAGIYAVVVWKCTLSTLAYPSNTILLTNSAPTTLSLGTINGVAASTASLSRAAGPAISGLLYARGLETGYSGTVWWFTALVTVLGAWISFAIPEPRGRLDEKDPAEATGGPSLPRESLESSRL